MAKILDGLTKVHLWTLVGFAGIGGICAAGMGRLFVHKLQRQVTDQPFYSKSLDVFFRNSQAIELIGRPVKTKRIDFSDDSNIFTNNHVTFKIPVVGKKMSGQLLVDSSRISDTDWELNFVKFCTDDKTFVIFRSNKKTES